MTTYLHLVQKSRMLGAIPPISQYAFMAWCLVKKKHWDTFIFTFVMQVNAQVSNECSKDACNTQHELKTVQVFYQPPLNRTNSSPIPGLPSFLGLSDHHALYVCPPLSALDQETNFQETWYKRHAIIWQRNRIVLNVLQSMITTWWTQELAKWKRH
jgi:hypothetical protein